VEIDPNAKVATATFSHIRSSALRQSHALEPVFVPPGTEHAIRSTGFALLVYVRPPRRRLPRRLRARRGSRVTSSAVDNKRPGSAQPPPAHMTHAEVSPLGRGSGGRPGPAAHLTRQMAGSRALATGETTPAATRRNGLRARVSSGSRIGMRCAMCHPGRRDAAASYWSGVDSGRFGAERAVCRTARLDCAAAQLAQVGPCLGWISGRCAVPIRVSFICLKANFT
jgi:hypothetical protein